MNQSNRRITVFFLSPVIAATCQATMANETENDDLDRIYANERMVSIASGYAQPLRKAPSVASVIASRDIEAIGAITLEDVLETIPGVHVGTGRGISPVFGVRGIYTETNAQVLFKVNDLPVQDFAQGGRPQPWTMLVKNIERIEIIRGAGSSIHGSDAVAGVINIITKDAEEMDGTQVGALAGSFDTWGGWLLHGSELGDKMDVAFSFQGMTTHGQNRTVRADDQTRFDALFGTNASLAPGGINTGRDQIDILLKLNYGDHWHWQGGYQKFNAVGTGTGTVDALDPEGKIDAHVATTQLRHTDTYFDDFDVDVAINYLGYQFNTDVTILPAGAFGGSFVDGVKNETGFYSSQLMGEIKIVYDEFTNHRLLMGAGGRYYQTEDIEDRRNFVPGPTGIPQPAGRLADARLLGVERVVNSDKERTVYFGYLQDEWRLMPDWTLTAGLRADSYSDFGTTLNPRASLVWNATPTVTTKILYGRGFRAPSVLESFTTNTAQVIGNPDLDPETVNSLDLVAAYRKPGGLETSLDIYWFEVDDLIRTVPQPQAGAPNALVFENTDGLTGYGLELEAAYAVTESLRVKMNYTAQATREREGKQNFGLLPNHQVFAQIDWRLNPYWFIDGRVNWVGERQRSADDPRANLSDYVDAGLTVRRDGEWLDVSFTANNLFDSNIREPSFAFRSIPRDIPMAGRSFIGEINVHF